MNHFSNLFW